MSDKAISFTVYGRPQTAGSKKSFPFKRGDGSLGVRVTHDNPKSQSWMQEVRAAARKAYNGPLLDGPLALHVTFFLARPKGHFGKHGVRPSAPQFPTTKPDCTKLVRCLEDALKGVLWRDDSQVVSQANNKRYGETDGAVVQVIPVSVLDEMRKVVGE